MKKYTMINFLKEDFDFIRLSKTIILLFIILSIFIVINNNELEILTLKFIDRNDDEFEIIIYGDEKIIREL